MSTSDFSQIEGLSSQAPGGADDFIIVDCSLPGKIMQLGTGMVYLSRGPSKKLAAGECAEQGGRFALPGQAGYDKALLVWMPDAKAGDKIAQNFVGEIYQRGVSGSPQYTLAAEWFRKAAEQGLSRAQMNLAYLYEKGLGVEKDPQQAQRWFRRATGLGDAVSLDENAISIQERQELQELRQEVNRRRQESQSLRQKLEDTQKDLEDIRRRLKRLNNQPQGQRNNKDLAELTAVEARYKTTIEDLQGQLDEYNTMFQKLPAPRIEVYDDVAPATRGVRFDAGGQELKKGTVAGMVWAAAGLANFKVNQKNQKVTSDGKFSVSVALNPAGETKLVITAVDQRGKSTTITHTISNSAVDNKLDSKIYPDINYGRYRALIIGNIDYKLLPKLKTAVNDARDIDTILREKYGFDTTLLINATRYDIMESLNQLKKNLSESDNLLIYYAGHGYMDVKNDIGYWQPVDADQSKTTNWIANQDVTSLLNLMKARHVLVVADSCYSGTLLRGVAVQEESPSTSDARIDYLKEMVNGRARKVLTSGELSPVIDEGPGGHSVFAGVLLDVLKSNDQILEGDLLHQEMRARVVRDSKRYGLTQVPLYSGNIQAGDGPGDFIFVPKKYQ